MDFAKKLLAKLNINQSPSIIGIVDDERCDLHVQEANHQESPERTKAIRSYLKASGLYNVLKKIPAKKLESNDPILEAVHSKEHIQTIIDACTKHARKNLGPDMTVNGIPSLTSALVAAGSVVAAVDAITDPSSGVKRVFCNVRSPGHHASSTKSTGFCIYNNIAVAAKHALTKPNIKRVLIFDPDLHAGDGTSQIFWAEKNVLWCSFHRGTDFYPYTGSKSEKGQYNNIMNFPFPSNVTAAEYIKQFDTEFIPRAREFKPDMIFISCGFDSHKDDLYHALPLDYEHFEYMTKELVKLADDCSEGRIVSALEGGYTPDVIAKCADVHIRALFPIKNN